MPDEEQKEIPPGAEETPEVITNPDERRQWSPEDLDVLRSVLREADEAEAGDQVEVPEDVPEEAEEVIAELEQEYQGAVDTKRHELLRLRAGLLTGILGRVQRGMEMGFKIPGTRRAAEFLDLHTVENVMEFALELFPFVGAGYAVTGYRLDIRRHPQTKDRTLDLEQISLKDRGIYLLGELLVSGHVLRGVAKRVFKGGTKQIARQAVKETGRVVRGTGKLAMEKLAVRAKKGFERERGKVIKKMKE